MNAPGPSHSPVAKAGWLIVLIFVGWLAFLFVPVPKPEPKPAPPYVKPPPSRLVALGLPDNPDLEHLPEFFAVFADKAEWKNDKTIFAYWNPGSNSYSYFFEAIRLNGSIHFKEIPVIVAAEEDQVLENGLRWSESRPDDCPIRFVYTDVGYPYSSYDDLLLMLKKSPLLRPLSVPRVEVKIDSDRIKLPLPVQKLPLVDMKQKN